MDEKKTSPDPIQVPIRADDAAQAGVFANVARITHDAESFQIDFLIVHANPPFARLQSRVLLTAGHARRLLAALQENVSRYEAAFGPIRPPQGPGPEGYLQ